MTSVYPDFEAEIFRVTPVATDDALYNCPPSNDLAAQYHDANHRVKLILQRRPPSHPWHHCPHRPLRELTGLVCNE